MSIVMRGETEPMSSGEIRIISSERAIEIEEKQRRVAEFLESRKFDALLLEDPSNFAWFTSGGSCLRTGSNDPVAALFITSEARVVVTSNVESGRLFDWEIPGAGFLLKERPWYEARQGFLEDLCRGRNVASDTNFPSTTNVAPQLTEMRLPLMDTECARMRTIARDVVHSIEATARQCKHRQTEAEIAGEVAHRLFKRQLRPELIQVSADGRSRRYRHWNPGKNAIERYCVISVIGSREGLSVGASRTVCFGEPPTEIRDAHQRAMLVHATGMHFSQADWELFEVWKRVARIYEKFGYSDEWQQAPQAELIGYRTNEMPLVPKSEFRLSEGMAIHWHPSIRAAAAGDTVLVTKKGCELLTHSENWPKLDVLVKGMTVSCPNILLRELDPSRPKSSHAHGGVEDSVFELDLPDADDEGFNDSALGL